MSPLFSSSVFHEEVPILIVGGGPSGLLLAYLLAQLNVRSVIIERYPTRLAAPKAHALSPRSLELCRQAGLDVNEIRKIGSPRGDAYWVNFITSLAGKQVGRLPYERMDKEVLNDTPTMIHNIPQPAFEELVADKLAKSDLVEIRKNHSFVSLEQGDGFVVTTIKDRGAQKEYKIRSRHVVACDGAKSVVRKFLGVTCEGEETCETMMTIHFNADLKPVIKDRVGMLHWVMDPVVSGFIIGYDLSGNQVLICNFDPEKHPVDSWNEEHCRSVIDASIGMKTPYDVLSYRPWILSRKVARSYRVDQVFLAGDAAHSFPPTGGLGLNSGLGDVHNLAYKLAAVHQGWGGDKLLDTYQSERRQIALVNSSQSVKNGKQIFSLLKALGTTDPDVEVCRQNLYHNIQDADAMIEINKGIEGQREHFDNLGLHIGYVYGDKKIPTNVSHFQSSCVPGARLPHAWIKVSREKLQLPAIDNSYVHELSEDEVCKKQFSTLDLCGLDTFTLIVDETRAPHFKGIIEGAIQELPREVAGVLPMKLIVHGVDFALQAGPEAQKWTELMNLKKQAILVCPDQHILACLPCNSGTVQLLKSLEGHLGW
ncbi:Branched-chain-amino-acid aminotransferase [Penicillium atrosanguineum]|uniref:Branched-chain-amino-acid aminotransferase n=1 Tax=Penicillium atrosanguineum TaxID=1132637 RepID=UPI0023971608|nr:Branched-chain-amino-acid aminotransferase [Penicillium atrosanguineum]KAJ5304682.1 Branched-chain-amino-acid aminotransferase [Penicillium atrosanguineum]